MWGRIAIIVSSSRVVEKFNKPLVKKIVGV
jgi:hypothetical protein